MARIPALWSDLDAKPAPAGLGSTEGCQRVVETLSGLLRAQPVAVVQSGTGGLHPYWRVERYPAQEHARAVRLLRRWGVLVRTVATEAGGGADNVFDPTRVLRVPGTTNLKPGGGPVTVAFTEDDGGVPDEVTLDALEEALDLAGVRDEPTDGGDEIIAPMATWVASSETCSYLQAMIDGWATDRPAGGRHQWLVSQATRLAVARRLGCIAHEDVAGAQRALGQAFRRIIATVAPVRELNGPLEVSAILQWGVHRAETMDDEHARADLGNHEHDDDDDGEDDEEALDPVTGEVLGDIPHSTIIPLTVGSTRAFPVHVLPEAMAAAVREVATAVQADPAVPATAFLGAAAGVLGVWTRVVITETWTRYANLYLTVVAESGDAKSPGLGPALEPLKVLAEQLAATADDEKRRARVLLPVLKKDLEGLQRSKTPSSVNDMLILQEQIDDAEAVLAIDARAFVDDVTPERLAQLLADNNQVMTGWNDEGALLSHMLGLYSNNPNMGIFLKAWDASHISVDRKGSNGTPGAAINLPEPRLNVMASVQGVVIEKLGADRELIDRGVVGRLLISWPPSTAGTRFLSGRESVPYRAVPAWNAQLAAMISTDVVEVVFNTEAQEVFLAWHDRVEAGLPSGRAYGDIKLFAVKIRDAVPRFAGLFARLEGRRIVGADLVSRAIELGDYYLTHSAAVVESWSRSDTAVARKVLAKLQRKPAVIRCDQCPAGDTAYVFHVRDANRWVRVPADDVIGALEVLEQHGYVKPADPEVGFGDGRKRVGKRSPHVFANPAMFVGGC